MNILHVCSYFMDALSYQENHLPSEQAKLGHKVCILTSDRYFPFNDYDATYGNLLGSRFREPENYCFKGVKILRRKPSAEIVKRALILFRFKDLEDVIRHNKIQFVHIHGPTAPAVFQLLLLQARYKLSLVIDCHSDDSNSATNTIANKMYYKFWSATYTLFKSRINKFLPVTDSSKYFLKHHLGIDYKNQSLSPLGARVRTTRQIAQKRRSFLERYNLTECFVIVNSGKWSPGKNIELLLRVAVRLSESTLDKKIVLLLIGSSTEGSFLEEAYIEAESKIMGTNVSFLRLPFLNQADLEEAYCGSDIGIWPGTASNSIQDAMACGVPVFLNKNRVVGHLVQDNFWELESNLSNLCQKIQYLSSDHELLAREKAKTLAFMEQYSWENIAVDTLTLYGNPPKNHWTDK